MSITRTHIAATMAAATVLIGASAPMASAAAKQSTAHLDKATPDINRSTCGWPSDPLKIVNSGGKYTECFENPGGENVAIYNIDSVSTGDNGARFVLEYPGGGYTECSDSYTNTTIYTMYSCGVPLSYEYNATMTYLSLF